MILKYFNFSETMPKNLYARVKFCASWMKLTGPKKGFYMVTSESSERNSYYPSYIYIGSLDRIQTALKS